MSKLSFVHFRSTGDITKDLSLREELQSKAMKQYLAMGIVFNNTVDAFAVTFAAREWCDALTVAEAFGFSFGSEQQLLAACCFLNLSKFGMWDTIIVDKKPEVDTVFKASSVPNNDAALLKKRCEQQKQKILKLQAYIANMEKTLDKKNDENKAAATLAPVIEKETVEEPAVGEITLPEKGILVVGGHPNVVTKLQREYPEWIYLPGDARSVHYSPAIKFVVFMQHLLTHSAYYAFLSRYNIPTMVTDITNIDLLLKAISIKYGEKVTAV